MSGPGWVGSVALAAALPQVRSSLLLPPGPEPLLSLLIWVGTAQQIYVVRSP